jgi:DoxX-like family
MKILGLAKILGAIAILTRQSPKLTEWAYAGFAFDFLGATASHLLAGDSAHAPVPFIFFVLLMGSYFLWNKTAKPNLAS